MTSTGSRWTSSPTIRSRASAPTTSSRTTCGAATATRRRATRTTSRCGRWRRPGSSGRCCCRRPSRPRWPRDGGRSARRRPAGRRGRRRRGARLPYWVVHGMTDWFWEWAGSARRRSRCSGLACALAPRVGGGRGRCPPEPARRHCRARPRRRRAPARAPGHRRPVAGRARCRAGGRRLRARGRSSPIRAWIVPPTSIPSATVRR